MRFHISAVAWCAVALSQACSNGDPGPVTGGRGGSAGSSPGVGGSGAATGGAAGSSGASGSGAGRGGAAGGGAGGTGGGAGTGVAGNGNLSSRYPGDVGIGADPAVLFHDDFESGWGRWDAPTQNTSYLVLENDASRARAGSRYLRSTVTTAHLQATEYISSSTRVTFERRVDQIYWRFYARFPNIAPNPHHWVRMAAGDETYDSSGRANTVPAGDAGFWFDFDANNDDQFNFYAYWYKMRSGRCNDGSATPGCAGDQGTTYYYGNVFEPPGQSAFPRNRWFCIEIHAKANRVGASDGELSFWIDDASVGRYGPGYPVGTWLRAQFHTNGCSFSACTPPQPFTGFDFRSASDVGYKSLFLDAYYERNTSASKRAVLEGRGLTVSDEQTILYDDVVVATERIGCAR
ncbi:MAG TPA: hypothetical protein VK524_12455 [Polyangiaceae bacterium]|nr:hypothetical protein [Polyangiaceae bacterium]